MKAFCHRSSTKTVIQTMDKLPAKLLSKIMLFLPLVDRLECSLVCRRWAEAMTSSQLLNDVWLNIAGHELEAAKSVLVRSLRQYTKLVLYDANLWEFDSAFWGKIGENLRELELEECSWSSRVFYAIFRQCTKLESLKVVDGECLKISIHNFDLPEGACREELCASLSHLRHLHLDIELTTEILDLLLGLIPKVTSIFLSTDFGENSDFLERLPLLLEKNRIIHTRADFRYMEIGSEQIIKFVEITSGSLEELQTDGRGLTESACDAIVHCTMLRRLELAHLSESFRASHLEKLVSSSPDLKILELYYIQHLRDEDMVPLFKLKKLHTLTLRVFCAVTCGITNETLCRLGEITTLVKLDLIGFNVDSRLMRSLGCLMNLRSFSLDACTDSECFEAICENFKRLAKLDLGDVRNLSDADGLKLCRFKELRSLRFRYGHGFTDLTFERGVGSRAMRSLIIRGCSLTDAGLASIASHHDRLETLTLHECKNITEAGVAALLHKEPRLKIFEYACCSPLRCKLRADLRAICPRLRHWRLYWT